jgi:Protein of unknown function (DUF2934)
MKHLEPEASSLSRPIPINLQEQRRTEVQQGIDVQEGIDVREQEVRKRAYEIYEQRAGAPGSAVEDWLQAESEILDNTGRPRKAA